jgi:hypothetical protein
VVEHAHIVVTGVLHPPVGVIGPGPAAAFA